MQNARWNDVKHRRLSVDNEGMAGVVPALKAGDEVRTGPEPINDFPFAFVTPLGADCDDGRHTYNSSS